MTVRAWLQKTSRRNLRRNYTVSRMHRFITSLLPTRQLCGATTPGHWRHTNTADG